MQQLNLLNRIDEFTATMKPLGAAKSRKILETVVSVRGRFAPRVEHLHALMAEGYKVGRKTICGQRVIEAPDGRFFVQSDLSKTAIDYVMFCVGEL